MVKGRNNPRILALDIINRFFEGSRPLKDIIYEALDSCALKEADRRFVFNIAKGTVRYYLRWDHLISHIAGRELKNIDPGILNILRMGAYQCYFMESVPAYSTVDESVKLAKRESRAAPGFVNAVMRRLTAIQDPVRYLEELLDEKGATDEERISAIYSFPGWLAGYWIKHFGIHKTVRICSSLNQVPVFYIRMSRDRYLEAYQDKVAEDTDIHRIITGRLEYFRAEPVGIKAADLTGIEPALDRVLGTLKGGKLKKEDLLFPEAAAISSPLGMEKETLYRRGVITVQDLSSQMGVKYFLEPARDEAILDCCAAPGGKTSFAALLMQNTGRIAAVEKNRGKTGMLEENLERMGVKNTAVITADSSRPGFLDGLLPEGQGYFDRILVDAPCTALGTIAKNPEVKYNRSPADVKRLSQLSLDIMSACHPYLRRGGRLVYYTCTISPEENENTVRRFISRMEGVYSIATCRGAYMELEIMPYYLGSEGGYVCVLYKKA